MKFSKEINERAWKLRRKGYSWSESVKLAMRAQKVVELMRAGRIVKLTFQKADGSMTSRLGTLDPTFLSGLGFAGSDRKKTSEKVSFYSLTDEGFRSFMPQRLESWEMMGQEAVILEPLKMAA